MAAAQKLGRKWIGIDISQSAVRVVEQRLQKLGAANYEVHGLVKSLKELRALDLFEFQNWAINAAPPLSTGYLEGVGTAGLKPRPSETRTQGR